MLFGKDWQYTFIHKNDALSWMRSPGRRGSVRSMGAQSGDVRIYWHSFHSSWLWHHFIRPCQAGSTNGDWWMSPGLIYMRNINVYCHAMVTNVERSKCSHMAHVPGWNVRIESSNVHCVWGELWSERHNKFLDEAMCGYQAAIFVGCINTLTGSASWCQFIEFRATVFYVRLV